MNRKDNQMENHPSNIQTISYSGNKSYYAKKDNHPYEEKASTLQVSSMPNVSPLVALNEDQLVQNFRNYET